MAIASSLFTLTRGFVSFLMFEVPLFPAAESVEDDPAIVYADFRCDDDLPAFSADGTYREDCTYRGCGFNDDVCYHDDFFERCLDASGESTGQCSETVSKCRGVLGCFGMWLDCGGAYNCTHPAIIGCKEASCTED